MVLVSLFGYLCLPLIIYRLSDIFIYLYRLTDIALLSGEKNMNGCCDVKSGCTNRNFLTKEEKAEMLNEYKESLENELKGVGERIKELSKN